MRPPPIPSSRKSSVLFLVLGLPFLLTGIGLLIAAPLGFIKERAFLARAEHTAGTVDHFNSEVRTSGKYNDYKTTYFKPVYTFTDRAGRRYKAISADESSGRPAYKVGQSVQVLYDPADPERSQLDTFSSSWGSSLWMTGFGVLLTAVCLWLAVGCVRGLRLSKDPAGSAPHDPAILSGP